MRKFWIFWLIFNVLLFFIPKEMVYGSALIMLPIVGLFVYAMVTKDIIQSLLMAMLSMYILCYKQDILGGLSAGLVSSLTDANNVEMYVCFFLCGAVNCAIERSGGAGSFSDFVISKMGNSERRILVSAGLYAGAVSVNDFIAAFTAGAAFTPLIDKCKKTRLGLAYVIRTFCICVSAMLPFGAWGYFIIYQINGADSVSDRQEAASIFMSSVPYIFYGFVACIIALLFAFGIIPRIGAMKKAYEKGSSDEDEIAAPKGDKHMLGAWNLILPIAVQVIALIATNLECVKAFLITIVFMGILYIAQKIFSIGEFVECIVDGCRDMVDMVIILVTAYTMQYTMYEAGLTTLLKSLCGGISVVWLIPFVLFVIFCLTEFLFSLNYTLFVITLPVLLEVLPVTGANIPLCIGAVISAALFGANACIVSDLGVVSAKACRVDVYEQYKTSQPYVMVAGALSAILYLIAGFIFR